MWVYIHTHVDICAYVGPLCVWKCTSRYVCARARVRVSVPTMPDEPLADALEQCAGAAEVCDGGRGDLGNDVVARKGLSLGLEPAHLAAGHVRGKLGQRDQEQA